jgi:hypothetical protein
MKNTQCEHGEAVLRALAAGSWPDELRDHLAGCRSCADVVTVARALREVADDASSKPLPDPGKIWRVAQRSERLAAAERATWPIKLTTRVALTACVVAAGAGLVWMWPAFMSQVSATVAWFSHRTVIDTGQIFTAILGFASLAAFLAAFALFESWARE